MFMCQICNKECSTLNSLSKHITCIHRNKEEYYNTYIKKDSDNDGVCKNENCSNKTKFDGLLKGYRGFCSMKCMANSNITKKKIEQTCLNKYGTTSVLGNDDIKKRIKQTNIEKYGAENPFLNEDVKNKYKKTMIDRYGYEHNFKNGNNKKYIQEKYGVDNPSQISTYREKYESTCLDRYGVTNPQQSEEIREKSKRTNLEKYGVENPAQNKNVRKKMEQTCLDKYGVKSPFESDEIKNKIRETTNLKYGGFTLESEELSEKVKNTLINKYGVDNYCKSDEYKKIIRSTFFDKLLNTDRLKNLVSPNFNKNEYETSRLIYSWKCMKCGNIFDDTIADGKIPRCLKCFPFNINTSNMEFELGEYIKSLEIEFILNYRGLIPPKEIDIYIPEKQLGIEFNGLLWHSEIFGNKSRNYHLEKTKQCNNKGVNLIHIFEDEWVEKQNIVKSILSYKLDKIETKIYPRKCNIEIVENDSAFKFFEDNHIQGYRNGLHIGLFYNKELVSCITFVKSSNPKFEWELSRFCNKIFASVPGAFSKLLSFFELNYNPKSIITYADIRISQGDLYKKNEFSVVSINDPSYYYTMGNRRYHKRNFQKSIIKNRFSIYDENLTEWENAQTNGYDRIWDCGTTTFGKVCNDNM